MKTPAWQRAEGKKMPSPSPFVADGTKPCTKCGSIFPLSSFYTTGKLASGRPKYNSWCKVCIKEKMSSYHKRTWGEERLNFTALKRTSSVRSYLSYLLAKAKRRKDCEISLDYLENLWRVQSGRCALSGIEMTRVLGRGIVQTNASIDRIDASKGYERGNVQLVCRSVNVMKMDMSQSEFLALCRSIVEACDAKDPSLAA